MKRILNIITMILSALLVFALLITSIINVEKVAIIVESISLTVTFTANITMNLYFIKRANKIEIEYANLIKIAESEVVEINKADLLNIEKLVSNNFANFDDNIMESVISYMNEFEYEIENGDFSIFAPFDLDILTKPEILRRSIGTEKFTCRDDKINEYLFKLKEELHVISDMILYHSFSTPTIGMNKMQWIKMKEEQKMGKVFKPDHLESEKKAFDIANVSIKKSILIYKEMINYWRKSRKVAE